MPWLWHCYLLAFAKARKELQTYLSSQLRLRRDGRQGAALRSFSSCRMCFKCVQIDLDPNALNVPRPQIVQQAIEWAEIEGGVGRIPRIDTSRVYICGHSAGIPTVRSSSESLHGLKSLWQPLTLCRLAWCACPQNV
jgi:hypothetical protein